MEYDPRGLGLLGREIGVGRNECFHANGGCGAAGRDGRVSAVLTSRRSFMKGTSAYSFYCSLSDRYEMQIAFPVFSKHALLLYLVGV